MTCQSRISKIIHSACRLLPKLFLSSRPSPLSLIPVQPTFQQCCSFILQRCFSALSLLHFCGSDTSQTIFGITTFDFLRDPFFCGATDFHLVIDFYFFDLTRPFPSFSNLFDLIQLILPYSSYFDIFILFRLIASYLT